MEFSVKEGLWMAVFVPCIAKSSLFFCCVREGGCLSLIMPLRAHLFSFFLLFVCMFVFFLNNKLCLPL